MGAVVDTPLVLVALRQEAAHLGEIPHVLVGAGKTSAAAGTAAALARRRPTRVLNIGTAGALHGGFGGLHRIGRVIEHDFDRAALEAITGDTFPGDVVLDPKATTVLATGDLFVQDEGTRAALAAKAHLVDMEGYAVARVCHALEVPLTMLKVVSDEASEAAARSWVDSVDAAARVVASAAAAWLEEGPTS